MRERQPINVSHLTLLSQNLNNTGICKSDHTNEIGKFLENTVYQHIHVDNMNIHPLYASTWRTKLQAETEQGFSRVSAHCPTKLGNGFSNPRDSREQRGVLPFSQLQALMWESWPLAGDTVHHHYLVATHTGGQSHKMQPPLNCLPVWGLVEGRWGVGCVWSLKLPTRTGWGPAAGEARLLGGRERS